MRTESPAHRLRAGSREPGRRALSSRRRAVHRSLPRVRDRPSPVPPSSPRPVNPLPAGAAPGHSRAPHPRQTPNGPGASHRRAALHRRPDHSPHPGPPAGGSRRPARSAVPERRCRTEPPSTGPGRPPRLIPGSLRWPGRTNRRGRRTDTHPGRSPNRFRSRSSSRGTGRTMVPLPMVPLPAVPPPTGAGPRKANARGGQRSPAPRRIRRHRRVPNAAASGASCRGCW